MDKGAGYRGYYSSDPALDLQNPSSIFRENLRARVRENERRLGALVRTRGGDAYNGDSVLDKYSSEDWDRENFARPRMKDGKSNSLYDKLSGIEEGFAQQARKIKTLEGNLGDRDDEIKLLRSELVKKLEKIVELEFELKATMPAFDEDLLSLGGDQLYDIDLNDSVRGTDSRSNELRGAKLMVTKLMTDLKNLENRYKEEQLKAARVIEELRLQNGDLRDSKMTKVIDSEKRVRQVEEECARLEKTVEMKDRQIENLKKELANLRLNQLAGRGDYFDREYSEFDRNLLRASPSNDRSSDDPRSMLTSEYLESLSREVPSPGRSIRFYDEVDEGPLARTKEAQMALIQQSRMRAGSFENVESPSNMLTEEDIFPRSNTSRSNPPGTSSPRSSNEASRSASIRAVRAVKQDQEQAVQRAKKTGFFGRRRLFGRV